MMFSRIFDNGSFRKALGIGEANLLASIILTFLFRRGKWRARTSGRESTTEQAATCVDGARLEHASLQRTAGRGSPVTVVVLAHEPGLDFVAIRTDQTCTKYLYQLAAPITSKSNCGNLFFKASCVETSLHFSVAIDDFLCVVFLLINEIGITGEVDS
ncbi:hypothetical protein [Pararobbsia alpina]|uniref:hypothetical protein n=1 Tax=Pararobbsia alpina TaxID=621374 RepID=UPI0015814D58|nr:hypothetical protein [Pararobbsia alpina]